MSYVSSMASGHIPKDFTDDETFDPINDDGNGFIVHRSKILRIECKFSDYFFSSHRDGPTIFLLYFSYKI